MEIDKVTFDNGYRPEMSYIFTRWASQQWRILLVGVTHLTCKGSEDIWYAVLASLSQKTNDPGSCVTSSQDPVLEFCLCYSISNWNVWSMLVDTIYQQQIWVECFLCVLLIRRCSKINWIRAWPWQRDFIRAFISLLQNLIVKKTEIICTQNLLRSKNQCCWPLEKKAH